MGKFYIKSMIGEVASGISRLIEQNVIRHDRRVILYGLDRYAFAMRTILANLGFHNVECYLSDDEAVVIAVQRDIENFRCRFLNTSQELIRAAMVTERLCPFDDGALILIASADYGQIRERLEKLGYREEIHFYKVCDFADPELRAMTAGAAEMTLGEIQDVLKGILAYVDGLCAQHHLRYWVCGGTLLGTARHRGFIPWDDDADIFMPWQDYLRFFALFQETERFTALGMGTGEVNDFCDPFAKIADKRTLLIEDIGTVKKINPLALDVFPLVGMPADARQRKLFFAQYQELNRSIWQDFYANNGDPSVFAGWYRKQREYLGQYDFDASEWVGVLGTAYGERDCTGRGVYDTTVRMPFEDIEVNVPTGYREYLDNLYGRDWMSLPEESERHSHHNVVSFWRPV